MDPNRFGRLGYFAVPNNQTANAVDQNFNVTTGSPTQYSPIWDPLQTEAGTAGSPSTAPSNFSLDPFAQSSAATEPTSMSLNQPSSSRLPMYGPPGPMLQDRAPRTREGHERKRSRLSSDAMPFDNIDYWIQFDNDESLASIPEGPEPVRADARGESRALERDSRAQRSTGTAAPSLRPTVAPLGPPAQKVEEFIIDDSALENALSEEDDGFSSINLAEHLSKIDSAPPSEIPPREGLYSTPLSWEKPQPGLRLEALIGLNSPMLNEAEQRRLIAIAMNPGPSMGGLGSNINFNGLGMNLGMDSALGSEFGTTSLSQVTNQAAPTAAPPNQPKKQGSVSERLQEKTRSGDRTAHNDIERKYRTNLKDKIAELRGAVPALQTTSEQGEDDVESQSARAPKVSKGTVLTKATEYIHHLERKNKQIVKEHRELSRRLQAFEQLLNATARPSFQIPYSNTIFDPRGFC